MSMANDYLKHNEAMRLGWSILYFMGHDIKEESIDKTIKYVIETINSKTKGTTIYSLKPIKPSIHELFKKIREDHDKGDNQR
jgi:hypothetical protein